MYSYKLRKFERFHYFEDFRGLGDFYRMLLLSSKFNLPNEPVFTSRKLEHSLGFKEKKTTMLNQSKVVYYFKCDLCEAGYVGYTCRHLFQRMKEHSAGGVGGHYKSCHGHSIGSEERFKVLKRCKGKFDCRIYEMLFINEIKPTLNTQSDSIRSKVF